MFKVPKSANSKNKSDLFTTQISFFLQKTMVHENTTKFLILSFGFNHYNYVNPINHVGGMWVLWNDNNILANVILKEQCPIHMLVLDIKNAIVNHYV